MASKRPTQDEVLDCQAAFFTWCQSHDSKDWDSLRTCIAPTLRMNYEHMKNQLIEIPSEEYAKTAHMNHLDVATQHLVGGIAKWAKTEDEITATFQIRVAKLKYTDNSCTEIKAKANAYGICTVPYRKIDGEWKVAGLKPQMLWVDGNPEVFFGDVKKMSEDMNA